MVTKHMALSLLLWIRDFEGSITIIGQLATLLEEASVTGELATSPLLEWLQVKGNLLQDDLQLILAGYWYNQHQGPTMTIIQYTGVFPAFL